MSSESFSLYLQGLVIAAAGCVDAVVLAAAGMPWGFCALPLALIALGADWSMGGLREVAE